jgi:alpha,alpha-trehalose phosphorylase
MTRRTPFRGDPWGITQESIQLDLLAQSESVFTLSNGHIGLRGNLDEGEPHGLPGTYLDSFYELLPLPHPEAMYAEPTTNQMVVNVTNGKLIRLLVDDEPFDIRYGQLRQHRRRLDYRAGTLVREVEWESPGRQVVRVRSTRMVSLAQRAIVVICYEVEAVEQEMSLVVQSELVANEELPGGDGDMDPRAGAAVTPPLISEKYVAGDSRVVLVHRTSMSGLRVAVAMDHEILEAPDDREVRREVFPDVGRLSLIARCTPGAKVRLVKYLAYGWSGVRSLPALEDQVAGALLAARRAGFDGLVAAQRSYLDDFWDRADVELDGDPEVQQAVRYALWQVLQAGARTEERPIPAKGLTGPGYDGHAFWDTEMYVLPVLTYTHPEAAADALSWRRATLPLAVKRARELGLAGAAFPWRTINGEESSGYWPASTAAVHVNAGIADAVVHYLWATDNEEFARGAGLELLVNTARLWRSLGHDDDGRGFRIDGVTGPDEYSALADNNVYTNLMAARNLKAAADLADRFLTEATALGVDEAERASWRTAASTMVVPYDDELGVHPQAEDFTRHARWDFENPKNQRYPLLLHFPYFDLYRKQVVKQADLVLALYTRGDAFDKDAKARDFAYYEALTVRDSSLSACIQSIVAAEVGQIELAYDYLSEAALIDLDDIDHNTKDGLHIASLAGTWLALVAGMGGLRDYGSADGRTGQLRFAPRLPDAIGRLSFRLVYRGRRLRVVATADKATYELARGDPIEIVHYDKRVTLRVGQPRSRRIPKVSAGPAPSQPPGRAPEHRPAMKHLE